jgi:NAD(P)-dependent dehydrogenase (short-subunit alcohol dehydrogenase family)
VKTFVIVGGNSGIGLQVAGNLLAERSRVIVLGRDRRKGEAALASFGPARDRAEFLPADMSTHDGVRDAAQRITAASDRIDGLLHSAGAMQTGDVRTSDGIPQFFAVGYLGRYHLTQLLLPNLLRADRPRVVMMAARMRKVPKVNPDLFPFFPGFGFVRLIPHVNGAALYYAAHLAAAHEKIFAGVACPGLVRTGIFRDAPLPIKAMVAVTGPFRATSLETAANNPTSALLQDPGSTAIYWEKPSSFNDQRPIVTDPTIRQAVVDASRDATGV